MKPVKQNPAKALSLTKSTVMRLNQVQSLQIKGGLAGEAITTDGGGIPQTCGIACTDCMSSLQSLLCVTQTRTPDFTA